MKRCLVFAARDFQQVITELCFYRAMNFADCFIEHHGVKFRDHSAGAELTQIAAALS